MKLIVLFIQYLRGVNYVVFNDAYHSMARSIFMFNVLNPYV